ncbi:MAG: hypothetical protein Q4D85_09125 [Corynebacterium sp.]|uniref:hypothetical protein n=1 Tax=Corynebacterium sp. TaxID=1720 RepID=UPI0026DC7EEC|nr:hypothetical protein [Corynebacterium sp.]MDO5098910.1 hypothetical protein [Corynebacterium sp.]
MITSHLKNRSQQKQPISAVEISAHIRAHCGDTIDSIRTVLAHPRSLARPTPLWRPPTVRLPAVTPDGHLNATFTRHRVGPHVQQQLRIHGETQPAAYLVTARLSSPNGIQINPAVSEAWLRAIVGEHRAHCVHEITGEPTTTFVWLVDGRFRPIPSPASLFSGESQAA